MRLIAEFEIDRAPEMINAIGRKHWSVKHKERIIWQRLVNEMCNFHRICGLNLKTAHLTLTRLTCKAPDSDGLVSGFKVVIDSLVKAGVLIDDNYKVIGMPDYKWEYRTRKFGGQIKIKIETEEE